MTQRVTPSSAMETEDSHEVRAHFKHCLESSSDLLCTELPGKARDALHNKVIQGSSHSIHSKRTAELGDLPDNGTRYSCSTGEKLVVQKRTALKRGWTRIARCTTTDPPSSDGAWLRHVID